MTLIGSIVSDGRKLRALTWLAAVLWTMAGVAGAGGAWGTCVYWVAVLAPLGAVAVLKSPVGGHVRSVFWTLNIFAEWVDPTPTRALGEVLRQPRCAGNPDAMLECIDTFCWNHAPLTMNVGDVKGRIIDAAFRKVRGEVLLAVEMGAFFGYSTVRIARLLQAEGAKLHSVDPSAMGHAVQAKLLAHAGQTGQVECVYGYSSDHLRALAARGVQIDFLFLDHVKDLYLHDLQLALSLNLLRPGAVVVADNILMPGAPEYKAWVLKQACFRSEVHRTYVEYSTVIKDEVLVSEYLGDE